MENEQEELETEAQDVEGQDTLGSKPKQKRVKNRSPKLQLQICADELSELANRDGVKSNNRVDALIRKADILTELARLTAKEKDSEASAENAALKQQHEQDAARVSSLEAEVASLKASQHPIRTVTVPDPDAAVIRAANLAKDDLIKNAGESIRANCEEPTRLRIGASLTKKMSKAAYPLVSEICDWASIFTASQRSTEDLETVITQAAPDAKGSAIQLAKATLSARGVPIPEVGSFSNRPAYADVFDQIDSGTF